jgi:hypothetical protein
MRRTITIQEIVSNMRLVEIDLYSDPVNSAKPNNALTDPP